MEHDEMKDLPKDPELAFVTFADRERRELGEYSEYQGDALENARMRYVKRIMAFHDANGFDFLRTKLNRSMTYPEFVNAFNDFEDQITYWSTKITVRHCQRSKQLEILLAFTPEIRTKIHHFINLIRETIHGIDLPVIKREAYLRS